MKEEGQYLQDEAAVAAGAHVEEKKYWLSKLSGELVKAHFPYDDRIDGTPPVEREQFHITGELFSKIMALGNKSDARLHMILTTALVALLYKHTGDKDIILGAPVYKQEIEGVFVNTALALRNNVDGNMTFKELLFQVRQTIKEADENQNYPIDILAKQVGAPCENNSFPLFDIAILLENIQDKAYLSRIPLNMIFSYKRTDESLEIGIDYNPALFRKENVIHIGNRFTRVMEVVYNIELPISRIDILPEDEKNRLSSFLSGPEVEFQKEKTLTDLIEEQADRNPARAAVSCGNKTIDYGELNEKTNRLARYLLENAIQPEDKVGIMMDRSIESVIAIVGVWKAGGAYIPIDTGLPGKRIVTIIDGARIGIVLSEKKYIKTLNSLQWACQSLHTFLCVDSDDIHSKDEAEKSVLMDPKLWEYIGETAQDDIMGGGWISSYTGEHFEREVVAEFAENLFQKLHPIIHEKSRVLEIGSASGISMYKIAPLVGFYYGTDISRVIIEKNKIRVEKEGHTNIALAPMAAHEIDKIEEKDFDLVIINSVIQDFHGHNYLRRVIRKAVEKLGDKGYIFVGDVMDQDSKDALIDDLITFKRNNRNKNYKTKINWDAELFISRSYFEDLVYEIPGIEKVELSNKIHTLENELTKFRYDALLHVDKTRARENKPGKKHKYQHDLRALENSGAGTIISRAKPGNLAYVIYTSGSTGLPKGAMVEHIGMMNHIDAKIRELHITADSVVAQNASFAFDISVWQFFSALVTGGKTVIYTDDTITSPDRFIARIAEDRVTILEVVPSYLSLLMDVLNLKPAHFDALNYLLVTGEVIIAALARRWFEKYPGIKMVNAYGPTEVSDDITHYVMDKAPTGERIPIGKPIQNLRIYIVDEDMSVCPIGVKGEIWVSGVGVGRGYVGDEKKTEQVFMEDPFAAGEKKPGLYKTGDLGCWNSKGEIEFFGRKDHQVKLRGFRIELGEIENKLVNLPEVKEAVVTDGGNDESSRYLCAYIVPDTLYVSEDFDVYELKELLSGQLPEYMIPHYFVKLNALPLTPNGKIDRKNLPKPDLKVRENYVAPSDETEIALVVILSEVLGINKETIGIDDNFFDLGANSISVLNIQNRINKLFEYDISLSVLFLYPTVRELSSNIHKEKLLNTLECIIKLNNGGNAKNIFIIHPIHGMVFQYNELAMLLKNHFNVYGIQARGILTDSSILPKTSREFVDDYLYQIKEVQKEGPYIIGGFCVGSMIAYEIVKQLEMNNEEVETYFLLDEPPFIPVKTIKYLKLLDKISPLLIPIKKLLRRLGIKTRYDSGVEFKKKYKDEMAHVMGLIERNEIVPDPLLERGHNNILRVEANIRSIKLRVSGIIKTRMIAIKARDTDRVGFDLEHYKKMTHGNVIMEITDGTHNSMFQFPNLPGLAELFIKNI